MKIEDRQIDADQKGAPQKRNAIGVMVRKRWSASLKQEESGLGSRMRWDSELIRRRSGLGFAKCETERRLTPKLEMLLYLRSQSGGCEEGRRDVEKKLWLMHAA